MFWLILVTMAPGAQAGNSMIIIDKYQHVEQCQYAGEAAVMASVKAAKGSHAELSYMCVPAAINQKEQTNDR